MVEFASAAAAVEINNGLWGGAELYGLQVENTSTGYALRTENTADGSSFVNFGGTSAGPSAIPVGGSAGLIIEADTDTATGILFVERTDGTPLDNTINAVEANGSVFALRGFAAFTTIISDTDTDISDTDEDEDFIYDHLNTKAYYLVPRLKRVSPSVCAQDIQLRILQLGEQRYKGIDSRDYFAKLLQIEILLQRLKLTT